MKISSGMAYLIALLAGLLFFIPFLGGVHLFDWDEINFAESTREMLVSGNFLTVQVNYEAFWEKPPLFFWLQVAAVKLFGMNEFAMRFPNAIAGILSLIVLFRVGRRVIDEKFGLLWMLVYAGSIYHSFISNPELLIPGLTFLPSWASPILHIISFSVKKRSLTLFSQVFSLVWQSLPKFPLLC
ncbi:MAG: glycosyltransferase family 39 protein [Bacteroidales bacterium]|nr:glycosyltransferase family 39 protein [Bacteroidales bacterium]